MIVFEIKSCWRDKRYYEQWKTNEFTNHRLWGPSFISRWPSGKKSVEIYYVHGRRCRLGDGPSTISWYETGQRDFEEYINGHELHRVGGPAYTSWNLDGSINFVEYWENDRRVK